MSRKIITVGRQFGSNGRAIAKLLAENLGIKFYDKELIEMAAEKAGIHPEQFAAVDEKGANPWLYAGNQVQNYPNSMLPINDVLFDIQSQVIRELADREECVIVGRAADYVLKDPETCTRCTISELADQVQVSQPTVIRFVQALGFDGYRNFKYCLIRDRSGGAAREACFDHLGGFDLKPWDQLEDLPLKEVRVSGGLLEEALKSLSVQELDRAGRMLATARTIDIYGVENSCTPASDLLTKLTYLGLCCRMHTDAYLQQIAAAHLGVADVAVAFSHSGCSMDTVKALRLARRAGANTIAVTSRKNPLLAKYADVCLYTGGEDTVIYGTAIFSRIPDLAVVDLLYMGIIQSDYERFSRSLDKSGAVIADRGYPEA